MKNRRNFDRKKKTPLARPLRHPTPLIQRRIFDQLNACLSRSSDQKCLAAGELLTDPKLLGEIGAIRIN